MVTLARTLLLALALTGIAHAEDAPATQPPTARADRVTQELRVPMRDGVELHTVVVAPRDGHAAPVLLTRTAFGASRRAAQLVAGRMAAPSEADLDLVFVFQDVRGKFGSQGTFEGARPMRGAANPTTTDDVTDAWDTIEWLSEHLPGARGRVGVIGASLDGYYAAAALVEPHPSLRAAVIEQPLGDGWRGDDWFHNGAFRQTTFDFIALIASAPEFGEPAKRRFTDDYAEFLAAGSAAAFARAAALDDHPTWRALVAHPAYDAHWQDQSIDRLLRRRRATVPTLWVHALWDQEDGYGAVHAFLAAHSGARAPQYLIAGPWTHRAPRTEATSLGPLQFGTDTAEDYRRDTLVPFLREQLLRGPAAHLSPVRVYDAGARAWRSFESLPAPRDATPRSRDAAGLYFAAEHALAWSPPRARDGYDAFVSDPDSPVPFAARPIEFLGDAAETWIAADQSAFAERADVLTWRTPPLEAAVTVVGLPSVELHAATSATDADWVVKLLDVIPADPSVPGSREYLLPVAMEIFRGRYRERLDVARPLRSEVVLPYRFELPLVSHTFARGHRIALQVQSSWFPLYDRNPQTFVPNVFEAQPADFVRAQHRVYRRRGAASVVWLPIVGAAPNG